MKDKDDTKKVASVASVWISAAACGAVIAWELDYVVFWLAGAWLPFWPLIVTAAYMGTIYAGREMRERAGKPAYPGAHYFSNFVGLAWFTLWIATFTPLHYPVIH